MRYNSIESGSAASTQVSSVSARRTGAPATLSDVDQRYAMELEYLAKWQGPSPERARLMREIEARYRKSHEILTRPFVHLPGR